MRPNLPIDRMRLAEFCRHNGVRRLAMIVDFEPGRTPGLAFFSMQDELSQLFGRRVDLHTPASLSRYFRDQVLAEAEDQYVAA